MRRPGESKGVTHLGHWEAHVADKRIHGTTRKQVAALFEEERPHLKGLPATLFPSYQEARRTVGRDSFVEVAKAFYQAPPEYIGCRVWARWDGRVVRIVNARGEQVAMHTPGWSPAGSAGRWARGATAVRWWYPAATG